MDILTKVINQILIYHQKSENFLYLKSTEIKKLKDNMKEFVDDTVEELNKITLEARTWKFSTSKKRRKISDLNESKNPLSEKSSSNDILVTSLFRLYDDKENTKKTTKRKKRKKISKPEK